MEQKFTPNHNYEILTPNGWEDFDGVIYNKQADKLARTITVSDGSHVTATLDHRFFGEHGEKVCSTFVVGDDILTSRGLAKIVQIDETFLQDTYEIFNTENHVIIANEIHSHQCDEFAFVQPSVQRDFFSAIQPVLSTGGKWIITSTPKNDEDIFADVWRKANINTDAYGNDLDRNGEGINEFFPIMVKWDEHPDRDEAWAATNRAQLGDAKFQQEFECISDQTRLRIEDPTGKVRAVAIGDLYRVLKLAA